MHAVQSRSARPHPHQVHALRDALAIARVLNRSLILPHFDCLCDRSELTEVRAAANLVLVSGPQLSPAMAPHRSCQAV